MYGDDFYDSGWNDNDNLSRDLDDDMMFDEALDTDEDDCDDDFDDDFDGQPSEYEEWQDFMGGDDDPRDYDYPCDFYDY